MELQDLLVHHHPVKSEQDRVQWGTKESFSVKDLILKANTLSKDGAVVDSLVCTVWRNIAPPKIELMYGLPCWKDSTQRSCWSRKVLSKAKTMSAAFVHSSRKILITYYSTVSFHGILGVL